MERCRDLQVHIFKLQLLQADINSSGQIFHITDFSGDEKLFSRDAGLFYSNAYFFFVAVALCSVNMPDPLLDSAFDYLDKIFVEAGVFLSSF
jgi:hypothetical protein